VCAERQQVGGQPLGLAHDFGRGVSDRNQHFYFDVSIGVGLASESPKLVRNYFGIDGRRQHGCLDGKAGDWWWHRRNIEHVHHRYVSSIPTGKGHGVVERVA
jgi:hypothetical protein